MKAFMRSISFLLLFSMLVCCLSSCKTEKRKEKFTKTLLDYFDTVTTITGYADNKGEFDKVVKLVEDRLWEYHKLYDAYHSKNDSGLADLYAGVTNIKDINALVNGQHVVCKVDQKLIDLLLYCKEIYALTGGETNVAMGSVLKLWHDERENASVNSSLASLPKEESLLAASMHADINDIIINEDEGTVFLADPEMLLDVGAVAKGYATEMIARELKEMGVSGYGLSVGGNVRLIGTKPGGEKWNVGIENPNDAYGGYVENLSVADVSVVTSGSYQRYYVVDGAIYHHIIDKDTLYPSDYFASVSIITENSALADALSTALFSMPIENGRALINGIENTEAIWVYKDGTVVSSDGLSRFK